MKELLQQWAQLQPDWCAPDKFVPLFWLGPGVYPIDPSEDLSQEEWGILQITVQDAIASQGFEARLNILSSQGKPEYSADVWRGEDKPCSSEPQEEGAIALLIAYLGALKATKAEAIAAGGEI